MIPLVSTDTKTTPMRTHTHTHTCARVCLIALRRALLVSAKLQPHKASLDTPLNTLVPCPQGREQGRDTVTSSFSPPRGRAAWPPSWGSRKPGDNNDAPRWSRKPLAWPPRPLSSGRRSAAPAGAGRPDPQEVRRPVTVSQTQARLKRAVTPGCTALPRLNILTLARKAGEGTQMIKTEQLHSMQMGSCLAGNSRSLGLS